MARYDRPVSRERRAFYPQLGTFFEQLRTARGWKQSQAADIAARRGLGLSYQALRGLENGATKFPAPDTLRAVAALYELPYAQLAASVAGQLYGVNLTPGRPGALEEQDRSLEMRMLVEERAAREHTVQSVLQDIRTAAQQLVSAVETGIADLGGAHRGRPAVRGRRASSR